jgi:hypothetical protein
MRCGRTGSLQVVQVTEVGLSSLFPAAKRRMLRRLRETFFLGVAIVISPLKNRHQGAGAFAGGALAPHPAIYLRDLRRKSLQLQILQNREGSILGDFRTSAAALIQICSTLTAHAFARFFAEGLKRNLKLKLFS